MYLVYIIRCDELYYIGMTNDFLNRWQQHNGILSGGAKYTKKKKNWYPICIIDGFKTKSEAMQCEWKLKTRRTMLSRQFKGTEGRIEYLNNIIVEKQWTSNSPLIIEQNLDIYIDNQYKHLLNNVKTYDLYWK